MARTGTAEKHQAGQAALVATIAEAIAHIWATLLDSHDLKGSTPRLVAAIDAIVHHYGRASASAALTYYRNERRTAGITGRAPRLPMPALPSHDELTAAVEHALTPMYGPADPVAEQNAQDALASEVEQMVLDQSRQAVMGAAEVDKEAKGWARVVEPGACSFCAMLAARGAVYTSRASGNFRAHTKRPNGSGGTCQCHVEPVFNIYEPTAEIRQWQREWDEVTKGLSGADARLAWRQHYEGRPVTAKPGDSRSKNSTTRNHDGKQTHDPARDVDAGKTTAELRATLDKLEKSLAKFESPGTRKRVEELRRKIAARS